MHLFYNALLFDPQNVSLLVLLLALATWLGALLVIIPDFLLDRGLSKIWKAFWFTFVIGVPLLSGVFYGLFSLVRAMKRIGRV